MINQRRYKRSKPTNKKKYNHSSRNGGSSSRGRKGPTINISSFINKADNSNIKEEVFIPKHAFTDFSLNPRLLNSIKQKGYTQPTPIQDKVIAPVLSGKDVVGLANTGTGKTAAFLIPLVENILKDDNKRVLVVTPTRELAVQIDQELKRLANGMSIYSAICIGGENMNGQIRRLRQKNHFVIGTPGRLMDLLKRKALILNQVSTIVLDEADRMLDMGFIKDIRFIMNYMPKEKQTLCFSATMSKKIEALINDFLRNPINISVRQVVTPTNIEQDIVKIKDKKRVDVLYDLLIQKEFTKVLVFGRTRHGVENLSRTLARRGLKVESIHGNKSQTQRSRALLKFKMNNVQALIATDVAARGLHVNDITHVINYELPENYDDYIHRIGRTGRGARKGKALTFVN
jgi:ATP-dependent RNA helicase RhlE